MRKNSQQHRNSKHFRGGLPVWYENLSGVIIRPNKSRHKHQRCW